MSHYLGRILSCTAYCINSTHLGLDKKKSFFLRICQNKKTVWAGFSSERRNWVNRSYSSVMRGQSASPSKTHKQRYPLTKYSLIIYLRYANLSVASIDDILNWYHINTCSKRLEDQANVRSLGGGHKSANCSVDPLFSSPQGSLLFPVSNFLFSFFAKIPSTGRAGPETPSIRISP
jgi:hypothetical protein